MIAETGRKKEIIALAEHAMHYTDLLIKQCNSWLPENEGVKNMEIQMKKRDNKKKKR